MNHDCSGVGPSVLPILGMNLRDVARRDRIFMGMGTVDEQMVVRAQRTLMRRFTRGWERQLEGRPSSGAGGQPPLEGEDLAGVSDCASNIMRERVENLKGPGNIYVLSVGCYP